MARYNPAIEIAAMQLLETVLELAPNEQLTFIDSQTEVPDAVRARARALLQSEGRLSPAMQTGGAALLHSDEDSPDSIGPYRVLRLLGRGGMGAVYLGEQSAEDFVHQVAIKVIKAGLFSETLIERFRIERQTLAQLNHPHIARLYDGGEMPDGAPYLVMEYVVGQSLAEWAAAIAPDPAARTKVFLQICDAVEFAHQNLVIHRDLTPSNVLVTANGDAKLIDFGIARPQIAAEDGTPTSTFSGLSLTPGFAAPERVAGLPANTLVDIYSLGRIMTALWGDTIPPELAAIADKAQAADPEARYKTAAALSEAVNDWREHRPVEAFSNARWYRLGKFVAREKLLVGATLAIAVALIGGLLATGWAYQRAERERIEADQRFSQVRALAGFQLFDLYDQLDNVVGNVGARFALAQQAQRYLGILAKAENADDDLKLETARGYIKLALIQGVSARPSLGDFDSARASLDAAQQLLTGLNDVSTATTAPYLAQVHAYRALNLTHADGKPKEARAEIDECQATLQRVPVNARSRAYMLARSDCRLSLLEWLDVETKIGPLDTAAQQLLADIDEWPADMRSSPRADFDRALAMHFRATVGYSSKAQNERSEGLDRNLQADAMFAALERRFPNDPQYLYRRAYNAFYGHAAASQLERDDVAQMLLTQARTTVSRLLAIDSRDESLISFEERLREAQADFYAVTGKYAEAIAMQQSVIASRTALVANERSSGRLSNLGYGHAILGVIARQASERELACSSWKTAEKMIAEVAKRGDLRGYVADMRGGIQRNIALCDRGAPVSSFGSLND